MILAKSHNINFAMTIEELNLFYSFVTTGVLWRSKECRIYFMFCEKIYCKINLNSLNNACDLLSKVFFFFFCSIFVLRVSWNFIKKRPIMTATITKEIKIGNIPWERGCFTAANMTATTGSCKQVRYIRFNRWTKMSVYTVLLNWSCISALSVNY